MKNVFDLEHHGCTVSDYKMTIKPEVLIRFAASGQNVDWCIQSNNFRQKL